MVSVEEGQDAAVSFASMDRTGVFFSVDDLPVTGKMANKLSSAEQLRERVASWRTEYTSGGMLTREQHAQFVEKGWVIVPDCVPANAMESAIMSVKGLVDDIAKRLLGAGKIKDSHDDADFASRLIKLEEQFPHTNVLLHKNGVLPKGIQDLWAHKNLLGMAQQLLGDVDIMGHPVWNLRCKTPERLSSGQATVPWHQDTSYLNEECWDKLQVTAWVPLVDTNAVNGCMQVVTGGHASGKTANHACCVGGTWYTEVIPEELEATLGCNLQKDVVTCEVPKGSILLLNNLIPHRSLPNFSDGIRWSLDLRWQRGGEPNGFHGLKDSVLMKKAGIEFDGSVEWGGWAQQDRNKAQQAAISEEQRAIVKENGVDEGRFDEDPLFDTTIAGPWMSTWSLVHHNRHTAKYDPLGGLHGWGGGELKKQRVH